MIAPAAEVLAYCGPAPGPAELWLRWNPDPWLLLAAGVGLIAWRIGRGAATPAAQRSFAAAICVLLLAFVSPLCAATTALFSARVLHHVLLVAVAAPLLALALPPLRGPVNPVGLPLFAASAVLYLWHAPALYDRALSDTAVYWLMQASLLLSAIWFWRGVLAPRAPAPLVLLAIVSGAGLMGLLGALLCFAPEPLYLAHRIAPLAFGLSALEDQRLGGLIMWVPALLPYAAMGVLVLRRLSASPTPAPT